MLVNELSGSNKKPTLDMTKNINLFANRVIGSSHKIECPSAIDTCKFLKLRHP